MAILVVAISVIAPQLSSFFRGRLLNEESRRFLSLALYGQSRAVNEGMPTILWIDERQRKYGLLIQPGYVEQDQRAVTYDLGTDLEIEVDRLIGTAMLGNQAFVNGMPDSIRRIRFEPGGAIALNNPETIVIRDIDQRMVLITPSRNRLNYEIQTNRFYTLR